MSKFNTMLRLTGLPLFGLLIASLSSCQPLGGEDPLDQDAFVTDSAPVAPMKNF